MVSQGWNPVRLVSWSRLELGLGLGLGLGFGSGMCNLTRIRLPGWKGQDHIRIPSRLRMYQHMHER